VVGVHEAYDLALLKVDASNLTPVVWGDTASAVPGNWVAVPGVGDEPVSVGVVSVAVRKVGPRDLPPVNTNSGYLGVALEPGEKGVKITQVMPKSAADKAGFKVNDLVVAIAGKPVEQPDTMIDLIQRYKPGEKVTIRLRRGDKEEEVTATLDKRPSDSRSDFQNSLGGALSDRRGGFPKILQHDVVLKPNECGGPLVDLDGKVVGLNIARAGRVETYAVPVDELKPLLADLKAGKYPPRETTPVIKIDDSKLLKAKDELKKAEADLSSAQKNLDELRKKVADAKAALEKAEAEAKKK